MAVGTHISDHILGEGKVFSSAPGVGATDVLKCAVNNGVVCALPEASRVQSFNLGAAALDQPVNGTLYPEGMAPEMPAVETPAPAQGFDMGAA